ncbi:MAG: tRNA 2-thiouridine(34) synthase MnmA [Oscillospiraceae bacterium]|nr:tRNA 2-thiouridine(34) synthase MnmA [Oscillospiraceae bacterium]
MERALIAMSGGVDSSAAAVLMQEAGYDCAGATMQLFRNTDLGICGESTCCSLSDVQDAKLVCAKLGMLHYVFNFTDSFRREVMQRFADCYEHGATPNPCIDCNRFLKFGTMLQRMQEMEFDYVVTGHYARVEHDPASGRYLLKKGMDETKDQSYVLYSLTQEQLMHVRFPLGGFRKTEIREIAASHGLLTARKKESQDICFVPDGDYAGFLERFTGHSYAPGDFVDTKGNVLGQHRGIIHYTIGQRRGLGVAAGHPLYVCGIEPAENRVVLGEQADLLSDSLTAEDVNLIAVERMDEPMRVLAKIRYRHREQPALAWMTDGILHVQFDEPQRAVTRGQAVVLYDGDTVIGGGTIC